jgi:hypothetical protein
MRDVDEKFLVRIKDGTFLVDLDGNTAATTSIPSRALHVNYLTADQLTQRLKRRGYPASVVCDHLGQPMTYEGLQNALRSQSVGARRSSGSRQ